MYDQVMVDCGLVIHSIADRNTFNPLYAFGHTLILLLNSSRIDHIATSKEIKGKKNSHEYNQDDVYYRVEWVWCWSLGSKQKNEERNRKNN